MSSIAPDAELLTVPEAAAVLKVSPVTVSRWLRQGRLPAYRLGPRAVRIRRADLATVFTPARGRAAAPAVERVAPDPAWASVAGGSGSARAVRTEGGEGATTIEARQEALLAAAALREQILARRKGTPLPPLDADRKRGKRS